MIKKIFTTILSALFIFGYTQAQDFEYLFANPLHDSTGGNPVYKTGDFSHDNFAMRNFIKNTSNDTFVVDWRYIEMDTQVNQNNAGTLTNNWFVTGICDNINCRAEFGNWYFGSTETSAPVPPGQNMLIELNVYVPKTSKDTTRIYKVELTSPNLTDTAIFMVTKISGLGVSGVALKDKHVSIYPNPATQGQKLNVFVNKQLNASKIEVYNIIGQKQMTLPVNKEVMSLDITKLPQGVYFTKVMNAQGKVVGSKKFSKL